MSYRGFGRRERRIGSEVRSYGFYQCPNCNKHWESGMTYCKYLGNNNYQPCSKQSCKDCNLMTLPYKTQALQKPEWGEERHVDETRGHRSDLCERCRSGRACRRSY